MLPTRSATMSSELITKEEIWDDDNVPVPDWHLEIINERLERYRRDGVKGRPWEEIRNELLDRLIKNLSKD
jgi:putative addiction module component